MQVQPASSPAEDRGSRAVPLLVAYLVAYAAFGVVAAGRGPSFVVAADIAYLPFRVVAAMLLFNAARASTNATIARGWKLLAIAQCLSVFGNLTWVYSDLATVEIENWLYLAWVTPSNALVLAGFWTMIRAGADQRARLSDWLDASVLIVSGSILAWYFVGARLASEQVEDFASAAMFSFDGASAITVTLFAVAVWLRAPGGLARTASARLWLAFAMLATADLVFEAQSSAGTYQNASLLDVWYATAVILIAAAAEAQRRRPDGDRPGDPARVNRGDAVVFGAVTAAMIPLLTEVYRTGIRSDALAVAALGVVVLMLLVLWRQRVAREEIGHLIAGRLRLEQQLWQAQKLDAVGRLAGGIAHDFNNILAAISAHAQLLRMGTPQTVDAEAREIEFATQRAAVLVRRLLTFSRATSPERTQVVVRDVVQSMEPMIRQLVVSEIALNFTVGDGGAVVALAEGQLEQILLNLSINARDAAPLAGHIDVTTRRLMVQLRDPLNRRGVAPGPWVVLEVRDDGSGMTAETQSKLFQPFFTTKADSGGTGLGLATVAGIVQAADGHVFVESTHGKGTSMTVHLPIVGEAAAREPVAGGATLATTITGTILVVDDELPIRSALARYLSRRGHEVIEAADVAQALSMLDQREWNVDLILTDVRMPDRTGLEMASVVRARRPEIPILFMSGYSDTPVRGGAHGAPPAADTIAKPFDLDLVAERVRERLARTR